jgi:hypothetical protein
MVVSNFDFVKTAAQWYSARATALVEWMRHSQGQLALHLCHSHGSQEAGAQEKEHVKEAWGLVFLILYHCQAIPHKYRTSAATIQLCKDKLTVCKSSKHEQ